MLFLFNVSDLTDRIEGYFRHIQGEYHLEAATPAKIKKTETSITSQVVWDRQPEPALLTGMALFIGFTSMDDFVAYEQKGKHRKILRKARLRIEAEYEKKLHHAAPTGAMFALRCMGWADTANAQQAAPPPKKLRIEVLNAGPQVSGNEKDVII
ncbi:hypothetical protein IDJ77_15295 [Mucilaginibacter sp. ZT4R22]|uniref:Uncharacterized protein n=1 Tax=Mucilaginibacter pankratovii TaxID=2772110 RepID=A0ABR7WSA0_9SPHI|nr:terminase small subunit [Mucilaginibacter pankratovii]MBD1365180.1 hypothetical protein [Mucilaginibacter pankratovii]